MFRYVCLHINIVILQLKVEIPLSEKLVIVYRFFLAPSIFPELINLGISPARQAERQINPSWWLSSRLSSILGLL